MSLSVLYLAGAAQSDDIDIHGYPTPWLAEQGGRLVVEMLFSKLELLSPDRIVVMAQQAEVRRLRLTSIFARLSERVVVVGINGSTGGAACTALLAVDHLPAGEELLVLSASEYLDADYVCIIRQFQALGAEAGAVHFSSIHPRYAFVRLDAAGRVLEVAQRDPISRNAMPGFYWFRSAATFFDALSSMLKKDSSVDGVFYLAPVLNEYVLRQLPVYSLPVNASDYYPLKTRQQIERFSACYGSPQLFANQVASTK